MESHASTAERRGAHSVSRWSPTKEQIAMLENLYKQGIRTPNTEQIQKITVSLRAYGHIEGKNVFYWFQNHKARQRQKLKQNQQSCSNRFLHPSHPICQNVVCSPYCMQQSGISNFYPQLPNVVATGGLSSRIVPSGRPRMCDGLQVYYDQLQQSIPDYYASSSNRQPLTLFPLHPTGILKEKTTNQVPFRASLSVDVTDTSLVASTVGEDAHHGNQPFFDFFTSEQTSPESS